MQFIGILIVAALTGLLAKKEVSPYTRVIIGCVFGSLFFAICPFVYFYIEIHNYSKIQLSIAYSIVSVIALLLSVVLVKIKTHEIFIVAASLVIFILINIVAQTEDKIIKNAIAIYTNYYTDSPADFIITENQNKLKERALYKSENFTLLLSKNWVKQTDKGPMFDYFYLIINNARIAEFRPKCMNKNSNSLPESVINMRHFFDVQNLTTDTTCYLVDKSNYACRIKPNAYAGWGLIQILIREQNWILWF